MNRLLLSTLTVAAFTVLAGPTQAADVSEVDAGRVQNQTHNQDMDMYGYQLMTPQERSDYHSKMQSAKTNQERERLRIDHRAAMQSRAKERGITLPDESPANSGVGPGTTNSEFR